ncbi:MAG: hypothetical protein FWC51_04140 [Proteobacteria bacterium]|nr:hypothetical protein [Pseudomonadota bacterium]
MKLIQKFVLTCALTALAFGLCRSANAQTGAGDLSKYMPGDTAALKTLCLKNGECDAQLSCRIRFLHDSLRVQYRLDSVIDAVAKKYKVPRAEITKILYRDNWVRMGIKNPQNEMETDLTAVNRIRDESDEVTDADASVVFLTAADKVYTEQIKQEKARLANDLTKSAGNGDFDGDTLQRLTARLGLMTDKWIQDAYAATKTNCGQ